MKEKKGNIEDPSSILWFAFGSAATANLICIADSQGEGGGVSVWLHNQRVTQGFDGLLVLLVIGLANQKMSHNKSQTG
jgi:hypothetical protein